MANNNLVTVDQLKTTATRAKEYTDEAVKKSIVGVAKFAGSIEGTALPTPSAENCGNIYNVSTKFTTNENFVEPSGQEYPAGTNIAVVSPSDGTYKLDVLPGFIDFSGVVSKDNIAKDQEIDDMLDGIFDDD